MIILVNNSRITKMFWSVLSRPFIPKCYELADNKQVLRSVLSRPFRKHQTWSVVSRCVLSCDACVSVISCVYVMVLTVMVKGRVARSFVCKFPKQCGNTWGSYGNSNKVGVARSRWRTGGARAIFVVSCLRVRFVCEFS